MFQICVWMILFMLVCALTYLSPQPTSSIEGFIGRGDPGYSYYYIPWWLVPRQYNIVCDSWARRNCRGKHHHRQCFKRNYLFCVAGNKIPPMTDPSLPERTIIRSIE